MSSPIPTTLEQSTAVAFGSSLPQICVPFGIAVTMCCSVIGSRPAVPYSSSAVALKLSASSSVSSETLVSAIGPRACMHSRTPNRVWSKS